VESADEIRRLRGVIRDLGACLTLPALWSGREPSFIAAGLLDALVSILRLNFAYIRLHDSAGSRWFEAVRPGAGLPDHEILKLVHAAGNDDSNWSTLPQPSDKGTLRIARYSLDLQEEGLVVVGAERADFPTESESFVARAAITQAVLSLRAAKSLLEARRSKEVLEQKVRERTAELERSHAARLRQVETQQRLEEQLRQAQKMESIGTLAGGIAHDFNNILNIINGYASVIAQHAEADETIESSLDVINNAVDRGASVVRQLLTFARKTEARLQAIDASDVVSDLANLLSQTFPKTIKVVSDVDHRLPLIMADPDQINQALLNLCVNSRDAMPGGGSLTLRTWTVEGERLRERHGEAVARRYVCIEVNDTGEGIDAVVYSRMFEPFFTTKGVGEGTGLGLAMVYAIVKNHDGVIDVESERGRGAVFRIYLPAVLSEEAAPNSPPQRKYTQPKAAQATRRTILVAEDEPAMADLVTNALSRSGFEVLLARDGEEAIDLYRSHKHEIDLVVLDIGLPKIAGWDVIRKIKEENKSQNLIVASGHIEPELKSEMYRAGVRDFIYKPYVIDRLVDRIQAAIASPT
jgi:signal transduction histidine kinase/ActR/RegA family two-component response regulator